MKYVGIAKDSVRFHDMKSYIPKINIITKLAGDSYEVPVFSPVHEFDVLNDYAVNYWYTLTAYDEAKLLFRLVL